MVERRIVFTLEIVAQVEGLVGLFLQGFRPFCRADDDVLLVVDVAVVVVGAEAIVFQLSHVHLVDVRRVRVDRGVINCVQLKT